SQTLFQLSYFWTQDILTMAQYSLNTSIDITLDEGLLPFEIDKFNHRSNIQFSQSIVAQHVTSARMGANGFPPLIQFQLLAIFTHPANLSSWYTDHQGVGGNIFVD